MQYSVRYKIMFGYVDVNSDELFELNSTVHTRRGHQYKLFKNHSNIHLRSLFVSERVVNVCSYLPADVVNFNSLNAFKRRITVVCFRKFLKCS